MAFLIPEMSYAQEKCAVVSYQKKLKQKHPTLESQAKFENWLSEKIKTKKANANATAKEQEVITIPVVVHIIHDGEAVGVGKNVAKGQVDSQIDVLNEDFRRTNADASNTPSVFQPIAADIEIQFVLAKRDPEGLPTNGIVRLKGNKPQYTIGEQYEMKSQSYWPSEDYMNIWVADLGNSFLGYAQFPVSSLEGLEDASNYDLTDGIAIDFMAFGSEDKYPPANLSSDYNLGRTATHEVGHYLGLRHIWGDNSQCSIGDFCDDTPEASSDHGGLGDCTFPTSSNSCGSDDMFQNYMDYTDDKCMNLFTLDQKARMRVVMDNSPRRVSLKASKGGQPPVVAANDLGIRTIISPRNSECETLFTPTLTVRNYGTNDITSSQIEVKLNGVVQETLNANHTLGNLEIDTITFSNIDAGMPGTYLIEFEILTTNGTTDGNADNDFEAVSTFIPQSVTLPELVDFDTAPANWLIQNVDDLSTWEIVDAPNENPGNKALSVDFYNYEQEGELDLFVSPSIDISTSLTATLSFDVAFAKYPGVSNEGLVVTISGTCGDALTAADTIYSKFDDELSSISTSSFYTPTGAADWTTEHIDISQYAGSETVRVTFIAKNNFGNNLYLDNIGIVSQDKEDIALSNINAPSRVSCDDSQSLNVTVKNVGVIPVGSFDLQYTLDGGNLTTIPWQSTDSLMLADEITLDIELALLSEGAHELAVFALDPNGTEESNTDDNFEFFNFQINQNSDTPPIKESFEDFTNSNWVVSNPDVEETWEISPTTKGNSSVLRGSTYESGNQEDWLVSPTLDFRNIETASLNFNVAYAHSENGIDGLKVLVSTDCGNTYDEIAYNKSGDELATTLPAENFTPAHDSVWRNDEIDLFHLVGQQNVRIAFVSTNNNGNNIYLDDIQVYVTDHDNIIANTMYPNPSNGKPVNLTFDLDEKENVNVLVYDRAGHLLLQKSMPNTLNQTYSLDLTQQPEGIYLVKVVGQSFSFIKRLMLTTTN